MKYSKIVLFFLLFSATSYGQTRVDRFIITAKTYGLNPKTSAEIKALPVSQDSTHLFIWIFRGGCYPCVRAIKSLEKLRKEKGFKVTYLLRVMESELGSTKEFLAKTGLPIQDLVTQFFGMEEESEMEGKKVEYYPTIFIYKKGVYQGNVVNYVSEEKFRDSLEPYL